MTALSQLLGSGIKSIQRGTVSVPAYSGAPGTAAVTITAVNTAKTELRMLGAHVAAGSGANAPMVSMTLTNSTTITCTNGQSAPAVVSWELTERY